MLWAERGENLIFFLFNEKVRFWYLLAGGGEEWTQGK